MCYNPRMSAGLIFGIAVFVWAGLYGLYDMGLLSRWLHAWQLRGLLARKEPRGT